MTIAIAAVLAVTVVAPRLVDRFRRRQRQPAPGVPADLVELAALGVAAGMTFEAALRDAADAIGGELGEDARRALRTGAGASGVVASLVAVVAHARGSGTPVLPALDALTDELRAEERTNRLAGIRRLPVKLLFPLALLILPGFLLLTLGPVLGRSAGLLGL